MDKIAVGWCSVLLLLSAAVANMLYFPLSLHQQARVFQQGLHWGIHIKTWGWGIHCMQMCWLIVIKHAVENPKPTPVQPQGNGISTMTSRICWWPSLTICMPVVGENWVWCLCVKMLPGLVLVHSLCLCQRYSALLWSSGLFPLLAMSGCWAGVSNSHETMVKSVIQWIWHWCLQRLLQAFWSEFSFCFASENSQLFTTASGWCLGTHFWIPSPDEKVQESAPKFLWRISYAGIISLTSYMNSLGLHLWCCWSPSGCTQLRLSLWFSLKFVPNVWQPSNGDV